ncbi:MAG: NADH-quinone oxidoreductase subunit J [Candidatus Omnitrophica bacterium]|nr:NADH-quinone oxidoreductase subunit J [Candidatus Omnitrophota bacterium]
MNTLYPIIQILVYGLMAGTILAAIGVVTLPNLFHAALCLIGVLLGIAGVYLAIQAEFLAVIQILLYVGAVMTLVIFAVMMTHRMSNQNTPAHNQLRIPALLSSTALFLVLFKFLSRPHWPIRSETLQARVSVADLGIAFVGPYAFPFEVISIVLIAAMIGALIIAKRDKENS